MTIDEVMAELQARATEQTKKTYLRHGATGTVLGVLFGDMYKIAKKIKSDHALALQLWESGVGEGRILATMVGDGRRLTAAQVKKWVAVPGDYGLSDALANLLVQRDDAQSLAATLVADKGEYQQRIGWTLYGLLSVAGRLPEKDARQLIRVIEKGIHKAPNRARQSMNSTLVALGGISTDLHGEALAAARRIGPVDVDHGDTSCKTLDAVAYLTNARFMARIPGVSKAAVDSSREKRKAL